MTTRSHRRHSHTLRLWSSDWSLTILLVLLVGNIFALPLARYQLWGRLAARTVLSLLIVSGLIATVRSRRLRLLDVGFIVFVLGVGLAGAVYPSPRLHLLNDLTAIPVVGLLIGLLIRQAFREGPITMRRIQGAVVVYLLIGLVWALVYDPLELLHPRSFSFAWPSPGSELGELVYFSFSTLTSLGMGDVVPGNPLARSLVILEALVGQLFPAILLARLVAMELAHRQSRQEKQERL